MTIFVADWIVDRVLDLGEGASPLFLDVAIIIANCWFVLMMVLFTLVYPIPMVCIAAGWAVNRMRLRRRKRLQSVRNYPYATQLMDSDQPYDDDGLVPLVGDISPVPSGEDPPQIRDILPGIENATKFQRWCAAQVKGKTGLPSMTVANRLMVQKLIRDVLAAKGLRPQHYHVHIPAITAVVFTPSKWDCVERRILASDVIQDCFATYNGKTSDQKDAGYNPIAFKEC